MRPRWILFFVLYLFQQDAFCQVHKENEFHDSTFIYRKIEEFSDKHRITRLMYSLVFRPVNPQPVRTAAVRKAVPPPLYYTTFEGKIIREIYVETYDPFGYDTRDTSVAPHGIIPKTGNALHVKTWPMKIRNMLIIKKGDTFDSLRVRETERLIRSQSYVREVFVSPLLVGKDSVDIYIRVYDVWSILITGAVSTTSFSIDEKDKNILGTGHQFESKFKQNYTTGLNSYSANYFIPNIYKTYINSSITYMKDENNNYYEGIALNRSFYSVFTAWAGGASLQRSKTSEIMMGLDSTSFNQTFRNTTQDYWLGHSWQLFKGHTEEKRVTSLVTSARYLRVRYQERAPLEFDSLHLHANQDFYMVGIGVSKRQYKNDNYIFKYGYVEDVPTGRAYSLIAGYQVKDNAGRFYGGTRVYMANYHDWGYFNLYCESGAFFRKGKAEEGCFLVGINYFSKLFGIGRWKLRQFIKPQYIIGYERPVYDQLTLGTDNGIKGFNASGVTGTQKATLTFQLQSYAPWNILGFRFGPYIVCSFGMLGTQKSGFQRSPLYSAFGVGLLLRNDYLILSNFQVSLVFYPTIPGSGNDIFKVNPVKTTDFGFRGFDITQPAVISYQ